MSELRKVTSRDGVEIGYWRSGSGPPLVLVHGTTDDHTSWDQALPFLERHFTVCAMDRRGRGASGDAETYAIELEYDDVAAVCESLGERVHLLGHSYGACCALGAAHRTGAVEKLVLYEPPLGSGESMKETPMGTRLYSLLAAGDREGVLTTFYKEVLGMDDETFAALRARVAARLDMLEVAPTIPREYSANLPTVAMGQGLATPTMLISGTESPPFLVAATKTLAATLPNCRRVVLHGHGLPSSSPAK